MFLEIWSVTDRSFSHFGPLFALLPSNYPKNQNFEKVNKTLGDTIILHKCTKNHGHMLSCSSYMAHNGCNCYFSFWLFFALLPPQQPEKSKLKKK